ncbi:MAG TPA: hypothetical protein PKY70_04770, partial [Nakamurella multipartita]|nr:hypothetical protein [Nakamurella multipartita]
MSPAPAAVQRAAWQDLAPLRPTLTPTPPIAPLDTFTSSLATAHDPSFLAPLGHVVDPDGPSGHVDGLASPAVPHTIAGGPQLTVAPRKKAPVAAMVQRLIEPRVRFSEAAPTRSASPGRPSAPDSEPATPTVARSVADPATDPAPAVETEAVERADLVSSAGARTSAGPALTWTLPAVSPSAPVVRSEPLLSAPPLEPVYRLPVVSMPPAQERPLLPPSTGHPAPAVQRSETTSAATRPVPGPAVDVATAALTGDSPLTVREPHPSTAAPGAPFTQPSVRPSEQPSVQASGPPLDVTAATGAETESGPVVSGVPVSPASGSDAPDDPVEAVASGSPLGESTVPTLGSTTASPAVGSATPVQRQVDNPAPPRSTGLGAPLTSVPVRSQETVVREPQPTDFATIMRMIDSAAAAGSTEISLPAPTPTAADRPVVTPTAGRPLSPPRRPGLGAPLNSSVPPTVSRSIADTPSVPPLPLSGARPPAERRPDATPVPPASEPNAAASDAGNAIETVPTPTPTPTPMSTPTPMPGPEPVAGPMVERSEHEIAPTLGADSLDVHGSVDGGPGPAAHHHGDSDRDADRPVPPHPASGPAPSAAPGGPSVQRLADDGPAPAGLAGLPLLAAPRSAPAAPRTVPTMMAPLLGDTSPYRPSPVQPGPAGAGATVQRFGLPGASSLLDSATKSVGGLSDAARGAAGGALGSVRGLAGNAADTARGYAGTAVGGAQQAAGGYLDAARG